MNFWLIIFTIYIITILISWTIFRFLIKKEPDLLDIDDIEETLSTFLIIFIPVINICAAFYLMWTYLVDVLDIDGETLSRKLFCIGDKIDEDKGIFDREGYRK